jgi:hypothetical protein
MSLDVARLLLSLAAARISLLQGPHIIFCCDEPTSAGIRTYL